MVFKLVIYQEWLTSSSWMGDDCAPPPTGHPSSFISSAPTFPSTASSSPLSPHWEKCRNCGIGCMQPWKKNLKKNIQKKILYCTLLSFSKLCSKSTLYIKMYNTFGRNIIVLYPYFLALKIKVTALSKFLFFVIFLCNKCGNRTRIYC